MITPNDFFKKRRAGILLHPTSLPQTPGNGDIGTQAFYFVDFLASTNTSVWQMLPIGPPHEDLSPYQCQSVHAANPLLISLERLAERNWLTTDRGCPPGKSPTEYRYARLKEARQGFVHRANNEERIAYTEFANHHAHWLEDYALFRALKEDYALFRILKEQHHLPPEKYGNTWWDWLNTYRKHQPSALNQSQQRLRYHEVPWWEWPAAYRDRDTQALEKARLCLASSMEQQRFEQFIFYRQWEELKNYAHKKGIYLFGDMPIFVAQDSVDVWVSRENFLLNEQGQPTVVTGVPPDYFSATGQRWGNPHYNWKFMQQDDFRWWIERLKTLALLFDVVRIDHFRGFEASWYVPAEEETAINGQWIKTPGDALFEKLQQINTLPLVAEDLGVITEEVTALRNKFGLPGMKILQFAFDSNAANPYLPHNHVPNSVVYTGTHDNNTTVGWFWELPTSIRQYVCEYLHADPNKMPWPLIEAAFSSVAHLAVIPMQDVLALDGQHRMNKPGIATGNWRWRFDWQQLPVGVDEKLRHFARFYGRI